MKIAVWGFLGLVAASVWADDHGVSRQRHKALEFYEAPKSLFLDPDSDKKRLLESLLAKPVLESFEVQRLFELTRLKTPWICEGDKLRNLSWEARAKLRGLSSETKSHLHRDLAEEAASIWQQIHGAKGLGAQASEEELSEFAYRYRGTPSGIAALEELIQISVNHGSNAIAWLYAQALLEDAKPEKLSGPTLMLLSALLEWNRSLPVVSPQAARVRRSLSKKTALVVGGKPLTPAQTDQVAAQLRRQIALGPKFLQDLSRALTDFQSPEYQSYRLALRFGQPVKGWDACVFADPKPAVESEEAQESAKALKHLFAVVPEPVNLFPRLAELISVDAEYDPRGEGGAFFLDVAVGMPESTLNALFRYAVQSGAPDLQVAVASQVQRRAYWKDPPVEEAVHLAFQSTGMRRVFGTAILSKWGVTPAFHKALRRAVVAQPSPSPNDAEYKLNLLTRLGEGDAATEKEMARLVEKHPELKEDLDSRYANAWPQTSQGDTKALIAIVMESHQSTNLKGAFERAPLQSKLRVVQRIRNDLKRAQPAPAIYGALLLIQYSEWSGFEALVPDLLKVVDDPEYSAVREDVVKALWALAANAIPEDSTRQKLGAFFVKEAERLLTAEIGGEPVNLAHLRSVLDFANYYPDSLRGAVYEKSKKNPETALKLLQLQNDPPALAKVLAENLRQGSLMDHSIELETLGKLGANAKGVVPELVQILKRPDGDPAVRKTQDHLLVRTLLEIGEVDREAYLPLRQIVDRADEDIFASKVELGTVSQSLGYLALLSRDLPPAREYLRELASNPNSAKGFVALQEIARAGSDDEFLEVELEKRIAGVERRGGIGAHDSVIAGALVEWAGRSDEAAQWLKQLLKGYNTRSNLPAELRGALASPSVELSERTVRILSELLANNDHDTNELLWKLYSLKEKAQPASPALVQAALGAKSLSGLSPITQVLKNLQPDWEPILPQLQARLVHPAKPEDFERGLVLAGEIGPKARFALPQVLAAVRSDEPQRRLLGAKVLWKIAPELSAVSAVELTKLIAVNLEGQSSAQIKGLFLEVLSELKRMGPNAKPARAGLKRLAEGVVESDLRAGLEELVHTLQ